MRYISLLVPALVFMSMNIQPTSTRAQTPPSPTQTANKPVHTRYSFQFVVKAPLSRAVRLFGPEGERGWAGPHWNPDFLYPQPGKDVQGAVFKVQHGSHKSVWVNTTFDLPGGHIKYVAFMPDTVVFTVDVKLTALRASTTKVVVTYERTALDGTQNDEVEAISKGDRESGPDWQQAIESYLSGEHKAKH